MEDDTDIPPERETKDFQFRQLKKIRIFASPQVLPKERSNLLAVSNKYGFLFAGGPTGLRIFRTDDVLVPIKPGEDPNNIESGPPGLEVPTRLPVHHVALSSDHLTLSVCMSSSEHGSLVSFYDVRTLVGESRQPKEAFSSQLLSREAGSFVTDLKWNPAAPNMVAVCLSDGSIYVFQVTDSVHLFANLPASLGVTCVCWSPKGKQLAVGKQNGTVVQYVPSLEPKKVIPCPSFYESCPVKVLDILWVSTYVFAVVYAAADGSLETSPQLVMVLIPKKEDKRGERFLNFTEACYSSCTERQHHFFMNFIDDWGVLLGASAASIEVSVIARPSDQSLWELWLLEDSSRAELSVTDNSDDTLPMGVVVSYTSQLNVFISEETILPPTPVLLLLSTDGVLCPFHMINLISGVKSLMVKPERLAMEGERLIKASSSATSGLAAAVTSPRQPGALTGNVTNTPPAGFPGQLTSSAHNLLTKPPAPAFGLPAASNSAKPPAAAPPAYGLPAASNSAQPPTAAPPAYGPPAASNSANPPPAFGPPAASNSAKPSAASTFSFPSANLSGKPQSNPAFGLSSSHVPGTPQTAPFTFSMPTANISFNPQESSSFAGKPQPSPAFSVPSSSLPLATPVNYSSVLFGAPPGAGSFPKPSGTPASSFTLEPVAGAFGAATSKPENVSSSTPAADSSVQSPTSAVRVNLKDKFGAGDTPQPKPSFAPNTPGFSFTPPAKTTTPAGHFVIPTPSQPTGAPSRPFSEVSQSSQSAVPSPKVAQKSARVLPAVGKQATPPPVAIGTFDKVVDSKDPIHNGIKEEIAHFQKELDDLKARTAKACFIVGSEGEMRQLRTESADLHSFLLDIQDTTKSLHGDVGCLKTTILEGLANVENAREQKERLSDQVYRRLLYKKPLDPRSEAQMQEIRRFHQYVRFEVQGVSDVLDLEWDRFLESKKKQKGYPVSERETLFNTLANNREIINQQRQRLNQLMDNLYQLRLYNCTSQWSVTSEDSTSQSCDVELESLQDILSKTTIDTTIKPAPKLPPKLSPVKQNQLRNFLTKRKTPPVRSLAPANLSRSSFLNPSSTEDLDDVSSSSSLSEAADNQGRRSEPHRGPVRQETPPLDPSPVRAVRHAPVARTVSMQPGFGTPTPLFAKVPPSSGPVTSTPAVPVPAMRVIPSGADSTMLATRTVKHGAPNVSATQAAAAAMRRQQITNLAPAALTESTLQTVPKVVNVKELKGNGPGPNIHLVMMPTVPQSAAQLSNQALTKAAAAQAKQVPGAGALKAVPVPSSSPQPGQVFVPSKGTGIAASSPPSLIAGTPVNKAFVIYSPSAFVTDSAAASPPTSTFGGFAPGKDSHPPSSFGTGPGNKAPFVSGSEIPASHLSLMPPSSSSTAAQAQAAASPAPLLPPKDVTQPANFVSGGGIRQQIVSPADMSASLWSFMPPSSAPADSTTGVKPAPLPVTPATPSVMPPAGFTGGETLGSFSGIRVAQVEDASKPAPSVQQVKAQAVSSLVSSSGGFLPSKPGDPSPAAAAPSPVPTNAPILSGMFVPAPKSSPPITAPPGSAPPASGSSSSVQYSAGFAFLPPINSTQTPAASIPVTAVAPGLFGSDVKQSAGQEKSVLDSSQLQALLAQTSEGSREAAPSPPVGSTVSTPPVAAPTAATSPPAAETKTLTAPLSTFSATTSTPVAVSPPANTSLSSQAAGFVAAETSGPPSTQVASGGGPTAPGSAFVQPPAAVFGQAQPVSSGPLLFGQQSGSTTSASGSTAPASAFGSPGFGATEGSGGFGQHIFGQTGSFWNASPASANNFSFKPSSFASQSIFGQTPAPTAAANSGGGGLFGSPASSFSFGQLSGGSTSTAVGGIFEQSTAPGFGQSPSTFGQSAPVFGSAGSSATTTTSSPVFGFAQAAGFQTSSSGPAFGQSQDTGSSVFGQQSSSSAGGLFGASSNAAGSGGFFSGLGGKPSQEAANKNPFSSSGAAFGAVNSTNPNGLFGESGAKSFSFGNNATFGDQKSSGTFSAGTSVASQGFGFPSPGKSGGFGAAPVFGSPPTFGGSPGFGGAPTFGTAPGFSSPLGSTSGKVFGEGTAAANTGGFGFGSGGGGVGGGGGGTTFGSLANQNTPAFGVLSQQTSGFGGQNTGFAFGSGSSGAASGSGGGFPFGAPNQSSSTFGGGWRS
ncbi:nuclear pore complex protein Nup214 isoform X2 [Rhinoderma darwinii]|uniref:nuclear pore complex protein Nup214 isoform X2 n=1 Tax=Rhinoderma darwinii TaxID=43563 RepID=UPI003F68007D